MRVPGGIVRTAAVFGLALCACACSSGTQAESGAATDARSTPVINSDVSGLSDVSAASGSSSLSSDASSDLSSDDQSDSTDIESDAATDGFDAPDAVPARILGSYDVTLEGTVADHSFSRPAHLQVMAPMQNAPSGSGANPVDFCLTSGDPHATPQIGAIRWGTSAACFSNSQSPVDLATVDLSGNTVTAEPDPSVSAADVTGFDAVDALPAGVYLINLGSIELDFAGTSVSGVIELQGVCGTCTGTVGGDRAEFQATISP
jgi:hypothetical protein